MEKEKNYWEDLMVEVVSKLNTVEELAILAHFIPDLQGLYEEIRNANVIKTE